MNKTVQKLLDSFDDSKRVLAKLMAAEDITIQVINGAPTASFDPVTRVLTVPNWPNLTLDQTDLLLGHEVGHALFTNTSYIEKIVKTPGLKSYWNVIEDTFIERKMKTCFPGLKRIFYNAYESFLTSGPIFRGTREGIYVTDATGMEVLKPFAKMKFIDRINALYKIGAFVDIPFTPEEQTWMERINRCHSTEDAMAIAEALYKEQKEKSQQQKEEKKKQQQQKDKQKGQPQSGDGDEDSDDNEESDNSGTSKSKKDKNDAKKDKKAKSEKAQSEKAQSEKDGKSSAAASDDDADMDDSEPGDSPADIDDDAESEENDSDASDSDGDGDASSDDSDDSDETGTKSNQVDFPEETDPTAITDQAIQDALKELADQQNTQTSMRHILIRPLTPAMVKDRTVTATDWTKMTIDALGNSADVETVLQLLEQRWNAQFLSTAKSMALEFERRKTAKTLSSAKIAKTGRLNLTRLSQYRFTDDLFSRVMSVPQGKSHGIVMTIDASGSMTSVFPHVLDQVLLFAQFAYQCQIPFEAYMFTDVHHQSFSYSYEASSMGPLTLTPSGAGRLVGLINTMDRRSFKQQVRCVLALRAHYSPEYDITRNYPGASDRIGSYREYGSAGVAGRIPFGRLGGTPLFIGLMLAERHVERLKRTLKLDKMTNVLITDGEDTNGLVYESPTVDNRGRVDTKFERYNTTGLIVRDTVTKKNHVLVDTTTSNSNRMTLADNAMLTLLFDVIKTRHDARNIMLFLAADSAAAGTIARSMSFLTRANAPGKPATSTEIERQLKSNRQFVMPKDAGVAELTIAVPTGELKLSENTFADTDTSKMTTAQVGKLFTSASVRAVSNRVFVNTVMPFLI